MSDYFDIMELSLSAYNRAELEQLYKTALAEGVTEHGFPRVAAVLGILISRERKKELYGLWLDMMELCCRLIPESRRCGNDFSVKEIMFSLLEVRRSGIVPPDISQRWLDCMRAVDPYRNYDSIAHSPEDDIGNRLAYNCAGEVVRQSAGLCDADTYLDEQLPCQLRRFDENGMYRDPHEPMLYDFATRAQLCVMLRFGYSGQYRGMIDEMLRKAGLISLDMLSATGEFPYGGRSNHFLFNEAYFCAVCEYEADRYINNGNKLLASRFKNAARSALMALNYWLNGENTRHVKNRFPKRDSFGCEKYAYYDKYMVSLGSFIYLAMLFENRSVTTPVRETSPFVRCTSGYFHKIFAYAPPYSIEIDTHADINYDSTGIGRLHKTGLPPEMILSVPFAKAPRYSLDGHVNPAPLSLCPGVVTHDGIINLCDFSDGLSSSVEIMECTKDGVCFSVTYTSGRFSGFTYIKDVCRISDSGVVLSALSDAESNIIRNIPIIISNGEDEASVTAGHNMLTVKYAGHEYYIYGNNIHDTGEIYCNRNGKYRRYIADGNAVTIV